MRYDIHDGAIVFSSDGREIGRVYLVHRNRTFRVAGEKGVYNFPESLITRTIEANGRQRINVDVLFAEIGNFWRQPPRGP